MTLAATVHAPFQTCLPKCIRAWALHTTVFCSQQSGWAVAAHSLYICCRCGRPEAAGCFQSATARFCQVIYLPVMITPHTPAIGPINCGVLCCGRDWTGLDTMQCYSAGLHHAALFGIGASDRHESWTQINPASGRPGSSLPQGVLCCQCVPSLVPTIRVDTTPCLGSTVGWPRCLMPCNCRSCSPIMQHRVRGLGAPPFPLPSLIQHDAADATSRYLSSVRPLGL